MRRRLNAKSPAPAIYRKRVTFGATEYHVTDRDQEPSTHRITVEEPASKRRRQRLHKRLAQSRRVYQTEKPIAVGRRKLTTKTPAAATWYGEHRSSSSPSTSMQQTAPK